jgi:predicted RNase H-like HicB family nuclease
MNYPIVIHKDKNSDFGVIVPDIPGCFSAGDTIEDSIENAKEAILCHLEGILLDNEEMPLPTSIDKYKGKKEYKDGIWAIIKIDMSELRGKAKRVNITMPENILRKVDMYAEKEGETRSGLLVTAIMEYISSH